MRDGFDPISQPTTLIKNISMLLQFLKESFNPSMISFGMPINIAPYLVGVKRAIAKATRGNSFITSENWNLLLAEIQGLSEVLAKEVMQEVLNKEDRTWDANGTEAKLLALGTLLTTWGVWIFKSKSENLQYYRKDDAAAVNRHTSNLIQKMVEASMKLCAQGGRPENVPCCIVS